jgi:hypothetical protein
MSYSFSKDELFLMEKQVFATLAWDLSLPTRYEFSLFFQEGLGLTDIQHSLYLYLLFLTHLDYNFNYFSSSKVAAAALHLTLQVIECVHYV